MAENYNTNDHINRGHTQSDKPRRVVPVDVYIHYALVQEEEVENEAYLLDDADTAAIYQALKRADKAGEDVQLKVHITNDISTVEGTEAEALAKVGKFVDPDGEGFVATVITPIPEDIWILRLAFGAQGIMLHEYRLRDMYEFDDRLPRGTETPGENGGNGENEENEEGSE